MEKQQQVVPAQAWYFIRNMVAVGTTLLGQASIAGNNQSSKQMEAVIPGLKEIISKLEQLIKITKEEEVETPNQQSPDNTGPKPSA
jgi:hypothetical protein